MAIVRNVQNSDLYEYLGENKYKNLRTGKEGVVDEETAARVFKINLEATQLIGENPIIADLIKSLNLKFHNEKTQNND